MKVFDLDVIDEVFVTLRQNKARALMTACGVFWGIFMLVLMVGFGNGLQSGVATNMSTMGDKVLYIWGQRTRLAHAGFKPGRWVKVTPGDVSVLRRELSGLKHVAPRVQLGGWQEGNPMTHRNKSGNFAVMGDFPEYQWVEPLQGLRGRFISPLDVAERRKVAVIGEQVRKVLFDDEPALGRYVTIRGLFFQVIGVFDSERPGDEGERANSTVHVPLTTLRAAFYGGEDRGGWLAIELEDDRSSSQMEGRIRQVLMKKHQVHPNDANAFGSYNSGERAERVTNLFVGIRAFVWFVSIATLAAGILGVSNIMLISVRERTREFGVRKALGATPGSVIGLVVGEALLLTTLAGYSGLVAGVLVLSASADVVSGEGPFGHPFVELHVGLIATAVVTVAGVVAGILPARRALAVSPVEALRSE